MGSRRAFTLIELTVIVLVLVLVAAAISPRMASAANGAKADKYRSDFLALLKRARETAVTSGSVMTVSHADGGTSLEDTANQASVARVEDLGLVTLGDFQLDGRDVSEDEWSVKFYPDGTADGAQITLTEGGAVTTIRVAKRSGRLRIANGTPDDNPDPETNWPAGLTIQ